MTRLPRRLALATGLLVLAACASVQPPPARATLVVECNVADASLWIDDRYAGPVGTWRKGQSVPAGFRRVEVRHPSHFSFFAEVEPRPNETVRVAAVMRPLLD